DMTPVMACADGCRSQPDEEQSQCIEENCNDQLEAVAFRSLSCIHCLAEEAGHRIDAIKQACLTTGAAHLYHGNNGITRLWRLPMNDLEWMVLPSTSGNRVALFARVRPFGAATDVQIACTHLSANQPLPPWRTGYASWHDERMAQFSMIEKRLAARAAG